MLLVLIGLASGVTVVAALAGLGILDESAWPAVVLGSAASTGVAVTEWLRNGRESPSAEAETSAGWREFRRELSRSRRHGYALTLVRLPADGGRSTGVSDRLAQVRRDIRRIDTAWPAGDDLYLVLPQTDRAGAGEALGRIRRTVAVGRTGEPARIAVFPDDGLTSGALIAAVGGSAPPPAPLAQHVGADEPATRVAERA